MPFSQAIAVLVIRLFAVGWIMNGIATASLMLSSDAEISETFGSVELRLGAAYVLMSLAGLAAFIFARPISRVLTNFRDDIIEASSLRTGDIVTLGSVLIGVQVLIAHAPRAVVNTAWLAWRTIGEHQARSKHDPFSLWPNEIATGWIEVAIALLLIIYSARLGRAVGHRSQGE